VEILVKDMTDEQVREMLEVDNVTIRQLRAAAKARCLVIRGDKESGKRTCF
jgi:hypothetical protein